MGEVKKAVKNNTFFLFFLFFFSFSFNTQAGGKHASESPRGVSPEISAVIKMSENVMKNLPTVGHYPREVCDCSQNESKKNNLDELIAILLKKGRVPENKLGGCPKILKVLRKIIKSA